MMVMVLVVVMVEVVVTVVVMVVVAMLGVFVIGVVMQFSQSTLIYTLCKRWCCWWW